MLARHGTKVRNLRRERQKWERISRVLGREGTDSWKSGIIYVVVVQAVLLHGLETWVMTPHIGRVLGGFHHRVACRLTRWQHCIGRDGKWVYILLEEAMEEERLQKVDTYVSRGQNTVTQFIVTRPIMDLCLAAERRLGSRVENRW